MVAIVTGNGLGVERSSAGVLGSGAQIGTAAFGRGAESVYLNAANGNLVLSNRDEFLIGRGPDSTINRTYNSQGQLNDDNGDNWRMSTHRRVYGLTGTLNANGSTVRRTDWDGSEVVYAWDSSRSAYVSKETAGAYDTITRANTTSTTPWIWTDGDSQYSESYDDANGGRITSRRDTERDGSNNPTNAVTYGYDASGRLNRVTTADGNFTDLVWDDTVGKTNNLLFLTTSFTDIATSTTKYLTRTRYAYDASNRLETVTVDLSPEHASGVAARDAAVSDNVKYTTTYTYDGASRRVASIAQTDGSLLAFTYVLVDGAHRIASFTQTVDTGVIRTTNFAYNTLNRTTTITDPAGVVTTLTYDSANHLIRQSVTPISGGNEQITTYSYVGNGFAARNLARESATLNVNTRWAQVTVTVVANDAAQPAPNGAGNTAEKLTFGASGGKLTQDIAANVVNGVRYVADIWVYSATATTVKWGILEGTNTPAIHNVAANTWTRLRAEGVFTPGINQRRIELGGSNNQVIWATQAQVRLDSDPDIYIGTTTAVVTSTTVFGSTDDIATIMQFDGAANETANIWIEREDFFYNSRGCLNKRVDGAGNTVEYNYNTANRKLTETAYTTPDPDGVAGSGVASNPLITRYVYDSEQHLRFAISPEGRVIEYRYNVDGYSVSDIEYTANIYTGGTSSEADLIAWVNAIADKSNSVRTDRAFDFRGNQTTEVTYIKILSNGDGDGASGFTQTLFAYDQYGQLLSRRTFGAPANETETYAYDGLGRAIRFTDKAGVGTWTSYIDAQNRTVTTLASGLTTTSVYNRAGELVSSIEARAGVVQENIAPPLDQWNPGLYSRVSAGKIDGADAYKLGIQAAQTWSAASTSFAVEAGETVTLSLSLQAVVGSATSQHVGIYGSSSGWGSSGTSARIISGPGTIAPYVGGLWIVSGLSATEPTRIEITRHFQQQESGAAYLYVDEPGGFRAGQELIASAPSIIKSRYDTSATGGSFDPAQFNIGNWANGGLSITGAGTIGGGSPANQYIVSATGQWSGLSTGINAKAGDSYTATVSLKGAGGGTTASFGIYGFTTHWDYSNNAISSARIVSGPGTLVQEGGGLWNIAGLSATQETRVEIVRTFQSEESGGVFLYPNRPDGWIAGQGVIAGASSIVRTPGSATVYKYDNRGLLRIKIDPVGAKTYYVYDRAGRITGEIDADGSLTEYRYDAADHVIASVRYANPVSAASISALDNSLANNEVAGIRPASNAADRWAWNVYDKAGRLIETIDAAGATVEYVYDGAGRLQYQWTRAYQLTQTQIDNAKANPPTVKILPPNNAAEDRLIQSYYDKDGLLIGTMDEEGYLAQIVYDKVGRKIETIRYNNLPNLANRLTDTFATLLGSAGTHAADIRNYWIYDGRGLVVATIDGEGNVTRFAYTAAGDLAQEIRGQQVTANTSYTMATLPAIPAGTIVETTDYTYNALRQLTQRQRLLSNGHTETTIYAYNSLGKLVGETTSETLSTETRTNTNRYDAKGRLIAVLGGNGSVALAALGASPTQAQIDNIYATYGTRFVYDAADRLIQKITPDGTRAAGNKTLYYYDTDGQLRYEVNALGEVTEYRYNALEDKTDTIIYGGRLNGGNFNGGLIDAAIGNAVAAIANSVLDSRTQMAYTNRGELSNIYNPLYISSPNPENYSGHAYNLFGELIKDVRHLKSDLSLYDIKDFKFNRRGLQSSTAHYLNFPNNNGTNGFNINVYNYDAFGRVSDFYENITDSRGASYSYDRANRLVKEWEEPGALGSYRQTSYDSRHNKVSYRDRTGNITTFGYDVTDKDGNAISATNRAGHFRTATTTTAEGIVTRQTKNAYGQTISVTDGLGRTTSYEYDKNGNLKTVTDALNNTTTNTYDNADRLFEVMDARGVKTRYEYDAVGRVLKEIRDYNGADLATRNTTTTYEYDAKGQQIKIVDARNVVTKIDYDLKGQKIAVIQDFGGTDLATKDITTVYEYRADGKVTKMIEAKDKLEQRITEYKYDSIGRLTEEIVDSGTAPTNLNLSTRYFYDVNNNVVAITDARNNMTRFVYDKENRQIMSVSPRREVVEIGYDAEGRAIWTRAYVNRVNQAAYDAFGNEVSEATVRAAFAADSARDRIDRTAYDGDGRRTYAIDGEGYVTGFQYDGSNNIKRTIVYATSYAGSTYTKSALEGAFGLIDSAPVTASVTTFAYDSVNRLTSTTDAENHSEYYQYYDAENRKRVTNKLGGITDYIYDNLDRLRTEWVNALVHDNGGAQIATGFYKNQYEYDALGNVTRQVEGNVAQLAYGQAHETAARETKFEYDKLSRLTKKTEDTFQGSYTPVETYQYDARGNLVYVEHNGGAKGWLYYDAGDRKIASISAVNGTQASYQAWTYDGLGNALTERTYDSLVTLPAGVAGNPPAPLNPANYRQTSFGYDKNGRLEARSIANLRVGSWNEGTSTYSSSSGQTLTVISEYNSFGDLVREIDANSNITHHWYDRAGREIAKIDNENYLTAWFRDEDGNVIEERRLASKITGSFTEQNTRADLLALAGTNGNDRVTTFTYDKNGRRLSETRAGVGSYTVSAGGALSAGGNDAIIQYGYNALGQVAYKTEANLDRTDYQYDIHGRLTWERSAAITDHAGIAVHRRDLFYYDALGNLARSVEQGVDSGGNYASGYGPGNDRATLYSYDKGKLISMVDASGHQTNYQYDLGGRVTHEYSMRLKSDGSYAGIYEGSLTSYDVAGRVVDTWKSTYTASGWIDASPHSVITYNTHGEVLTKSLGGVVQEQFGYDAAGRVSKSTAGDGVWKYFGYDRNGNATMAATSAGADLAGMSVSDVLGLAAQENVNASYTVYDKRGMATKTVEEGRRLSTSVIQNLTSTRAYNAFGEAVSETDARGYTTDYVYNKMGRLVRKLAPTVQITEENGAVKWVRPTEDYYYDISGRMVGTRDAEGAPIDNLYAATGTSGAGAIKDADKGYLTTRLLLAGTGHAADGGEALVAKEFRPDSSIWETRYDAFGDARLVIDGLSRSTAQAFDKMGRVTQITRPATAAGTLIDSYSYDGLGQRLKAWNNLYGTAQAATTDYDALGRIVSSIAAGGDVTSTSYVWNAALATSGLGSFGGWVETMTYANGRTKVVKKDGFGRQIEQTDLGGHLTSFTWDVAGRLSSYASAGASWNFTWFNNGQRGQVIAADGGVTDFGYDAAGNIVSEKLVRAGATLKDYIANYNAQGWMTSWGISDQAYLFLTEYDAKGNIRARRTQDPNIPTSVQYTYIERWYTYDALDRLVIDNGRFTETQDLTPARDLGTIGIGPVTLQGTGYFYQYDAAGQRVSENRKWQTYESLGGYNLILVTKDELVTFAWAADGHSSTRTSSITGGTASNTTISYTRDMLGRVAAETGNNKTLSTTWSAKGQVSQTVQTEGANTTTTSYDYGTGSNYALGQLVGSTATQGSTTQTTSNSYVWYDGAALSGSTVTGTGVQTPGVSNLNYDGFGLVTVKTITGANSSTTSYIHDAASQGISSQTGTATPVTTRRMGGVELYYWQTSPASTTGGLGGSGSAYTVRSGDTLQGIAANLWGDASLWYKLAEANGLGANSALSEGQVLRVPADVFRMANNASTFTPYDAGKFIGPTDPSPAFPRPVAGKKCGTFGIILMVAIAVAVTIATHGATAKLFAHLGLGSALGGGTAIAGTAVAGVAGSGIGVASAAGIAGGIASAVAGSVASQAFGLATGIQNKFSFKQVALAGISAGVSGGLSSLAGASALGKIGTFLSKSNFASGAVRGALSSAITQGVATATGLQKKFSWTGVAVGGVVGGVGSVTGGPTIDKQFISGMAGAIAGAGAKSLLDGSDFGDNLVAVLPDVIGSTIGNMLGSALSGKERLPVSKEPAAPSGRDVGIFAQPYDPSQRNIRYLNDPEAGGGYFDSTEEYFDKFGEILVLGGEKAQSFWERFKGFFNREVAVPTSDMLSRISMTLSRATSDENIGRVITTAVHGPIANALYTPRDMRAIGGGTKAGLRDVWGGVKTTVELATPGINQTKIETAMAMVKTAQTIQGYRNNPLALGRDVIATGSNAVDAVQRFGKLDAQSQREIILYGGARGAVNLGAAMIPVAGPASRLGAGTRIAFSADSQFVGPLIGRSGFRTSSEFADTVGTRYQGFVDDAYVRGSRLEAQGLLTGNPNTRLGSFVDDFSQRRLRAYLRAEGITEGPSSLVQLNRYLRDPAGSNLYVRPDVRIPAANRIFDATVGFKAFDSTQITRFGQYSGGNYITLTRPGPVGGSYSIVP